MRKIFWLIFLLAASCGAGLAQNQSINELRSMFEYDQKAPLDVKEIGVINRNGVRIHDITYASPKNGRVTAYLVVPGGKGRFAGVIFGHWAYAPVRNSFQRPSYMRKQVLSLCWLTILTFAPRLGGVRLTAINRTSFVTISFNRWLICAGG